jgi:hypothetical protein
MQYNKRNTYMFDQLSILNLANVTVKWPCPASKGFTRHDHFYKHINTNQHKNWVIKMNKKKKRQNYLKYTFQFLLVYAVLMYYWFKPLQTWLTFKYMEYNSDKPIFEIMDYNEVYDYYLNGNVNLGMVNITW